MIHTYLVTGCVFQYVVSGILPGFHRDLGEAQVQKQNADLRGGLSHTNNKYVPYLETLM